MVTREMRQNDEKGRRDGRFRLKVGHAILVVFVVLVAAIILRVVHLKGRAERRLAALRAAGYPTSLAELALRNKLPMGIDNAASVYESAFVAFVPPADANVPYLGKGAESPARGAAWPETITKAVADCLAANEECLARLRQAGRIENCRYDHDYRQMYPNYPQLRSCAQLLRLAAVYHGQQGDTDAAIARIKDGLRLANSLQYEPFLIAYLVRIACIKVSITAVEHTLSAATFTDLQLRDLDETLAAAGDSMDLAQALIGERCFMIESLRDPSLLGPTGPGARIPKLPGIQSRGLNDILDHMGACIEAARLPYAQRLARFREIDARLQGLSIFHMMVKILAPATLRIAELDLRFRADLDLARTALAIERFRLATGEIPEQLADLVPAYLAQVPIDPFDGQPIRYRRTDPGYVLYSVMEDGQDNGGVERDDVGKGQPYDLCFIVTR
jgi:hypothetical protein